jgi:hypothetical protein
MNPWVEISSQDEWWVSETGWDVWARGRSLSALEVGRERLAVAAMNPEHRVRAAVLLVEQTLAVEVLRAGIPLDYDASSHMPPPVDAVALLAAASASPLAIALCDQDPLLTPHLDDPLVQELFSRARADASLPIKTSGSTDVLSVEDFAFVNDALAGALVKQAAGIADQTLLGRLINQGVLLPDALMLCAAMAL